MWHICATAAYEIDFFGPWPGYTKGITPHSGDARGANNYRKTPLAEPVR
jgi:hypothetical protein